MKDSATPACALAAKARHSQTEGLALFVPLTKGDRRGSPHSPPAAKNAAKLSQSFDSLAKGDKASITAREMYKLKIPAFAGMTHQASLNLATKFSSFSRLLLSRQALFTPLDLRRQPFNQQLQRSVVLAPFRDDDICKAPARLDKLRPF